MKYMTLVLLLLCPLFAVQIFPTDKSNVASYLYGADAVTACYGVSELICPLDGADGFGTMVSKEFVKEWLSIFGAGILTWAARNHFDDEQLQWCSVGKGHASITIFSVNIIRWLRIKGRDRARVPRLELLDEPKEE